MWGEGCQVLKIVCHQRHRCHHDVYTCLQELFSIHPPELCIRLETLHLLPTKTEPLPSLPISAKCSLPSPQEHSGRGWDSGRHRNTTNVHTRQSTTLSELPSIFNLLDPRENNNHGEGGEGWVGEGRNQFLVETIIYD